MIEYQLSAVDAERVRLAPDRRGEFDPRGRVDRRGIRRYRVTDLGTRVGQRPIGDLLARSGAVLRDRAGVQRRRQEADVEDDDRGLQGLPDDGGASSRVAAEPAFGTPFASPRSTIGHGPTSSRMSWTTR
ncbi:hypothetical protein GCM10009020_04640 [Natronoarchaeum mannanilyticum]|uniref:Uncharacterized protein n=1 Tax=Natronoarchaeum mannanilyticum TaxID=926360 RepID=A0AAV3T5X6_9EURY